MTCVLVRAQPGIQLVVSNVTITVNIKIDYDFHMNKFYINNTSLYQFICESGSQH